MDRGAGVADGTTSFYFRTRSALLRGVADQIVGYDFEAFADTFTGESAPEGDAALDELAGHLILIREEPHLSRTRARLELTLLARREPGLAAGFQDVFATYRSLAERVIARLSVDGRPAHPALVEQQASALLTFLSGVVFGLASGADEATTREDVRRQLRAVISGVAVECADRDRYAPSRDSSGVRAK